MGGIIIKNNTTELLSVIVKAMSEEGIELTNVKIYEQAVELNNEVKVCITNGGYLIHRVNEGGGISLSTERFMVNKVIELLKKDEWLPGDDIEAYGEWFTLVMQESKYYIAGSAEEYINKYYRLLDEDYYLSDIIELEDLKNNYTNASLEKRLK